MQKKWIYYGVAAFMMISLLTLVIWKSSSRKAPQKTDDAIVETIIAKIDDLYFDQEQVFLRADLTADEISAVEDEFKRILIGRNLELETLGTSDATEKKLTTQKNRLETVHTRFLLQEQVNSFFLDQDYRQLTKETKQTQLDVADADELFKDQPKTTDMSDTSTDQTTTSSDKKTETTTSDIAANVLNQTALNGNLSNPFLIIADTVTRDDVTTSKQTLEIEKKPTDWHKALLVVLANGLTQLDDFEKAEKMVNDLFEGDQVTSNISKELYQETLEQVETVHNNLRQQPLLDKMEKVAKAIGEEFSTKDYLFEEVSDRSGITLEATQTNTNWWEAPISFSVTITNKSERHISFAYSRFVIQKPNKTINTPDFEKTLLEERFVVKKGESFVLKELPFKYPNETIVKSSNHSQLVYLLDKEAVSDPKVRQIHNVTFAKKVAETSPPKDDVSAEQLADARALLDEYQIAREFLSDSELKELILQAAKNELNDLAFLELVCKHLGLNYQNIIEEFDHKDGTNTSSTKQE